MRILRTALGSLLLVAALGACTSEDDEPYQASIGTNERTERLDAFAEPVHILAVKERS